MSRIVSITGEINTRESTLIFVSSYHPDWWNCNANEGDDSPVVCINHQLTCDGLPHCAKKSVPNPDENCEYHVRVHSFGSNFLSIFTSV